MSLIKEGPFAHFDCGSDCDQPDTRAVVQQLVEALEDSPCDCQCSSCRSDVQSHNYNRHRRVDCHIATAALGIYLPEHEKGIAP